MSYNFLGIVNDVNRRLNEVELTSSTFATSKGFYSFAKDAVNSSIRHINQEEFEWPFNHVEETEVLLPGEVRYSVPYDAKTVNIIRDAFERKLPRANKTWYKMHEFLWLS